MAIDFAPSATPSPRYTSNTPTLATSDRSALSAALRMSLALIVSGMMLGSLWLFLSVHIKQLENFAGAMNFVMFPMFFFSSALYPLWKLREGGSEWLYYIALANPFTHAVELIRFALYGEFEPVSAAVVVGSTIVFFALAVIGYNPQRGIIRRAPQPA